MSRLSLWLAVLGVDTSFVIFSPNCKSHPPQVHPAHSPVCKGFQYLRYPVFTAPSIYGYEKVFSFFSFFSSCVPIPIVCSCPFYSSPISLIFLLSLYPLFLRVPTVPSSSCPSLSCAFLLLLAFLTVTACRA